MIEWFLSFKSEACVLGAFMLAMLVSYMVYPTLIHISHVKGLAVPPTDRCSHINGTPSLGGVGIFAGIVATLVIYKALFSNFDISPIYGAMLILFFLGVKDDILVLAARTKFIGQSVAVLLVIIASDFRILSFDGVFGLGVLDYATSVIFTFFVFILVINSFNLIDGIDGLAGSLALVFALSAGCYFYLVDSHMLTALCFALAGTIVSFLYFNFSEKRKIFMGDTGSMIVGFLIAYCATALLRHSSGIVIGDRLIRNMPVFILALLSYPLLDTLRIFFVRLIITRSSPFKADKNHLHHRLLKLGMKHYQATILIALTTILLIVINFGYEQFPINLHIALTITTGILLYMAPFAVKNFILKNDKTLNRT